MATVHEKMRKQYMSMYNEFMRYESIALDYFSDCNEDARFLTNHHCGDVEEHSQKVFGKSMNNPYLDAYIFFKGEREDIQAMLKIFHTLDKTELRQQAVISDRKKD